MSFSCKRTFQNILLIVVCGLKSFQTSVVAAENSLLPILGNNEAIAPYQEFSLLNNTINAPKFLAGSGQKRRQPEIVQPLVQRANRWLDNSGQIEVTLADSVTETVPHLGWINVLLPIWSTADQLLLSR